MDRRYGITTLMLLIHLLNNLPTKMFPKANGSTVGETSLMLIDAFIE